MENKLSEEDKIRIKQASDRHVGNGMSIHDDRFISGAEYSTLYERAQQAKFGLIDKQEAINAISGFRQHNAELLEHLSEKTAEVERLEDAIKSRNILQAEDHAKLQLYEGLLKEVLEYEKRTVAPRPPHPYYTIVSRITEALKQQ